MLTHFLQYTNLLCGTLVNAFWKSKHITTTCSPTSTQLVTFSKNSNKTLVVAALGVLFSFAAKGNMLLSLKSAETIDEDVIRS